VNNVTFYYSSITVCKADQRNFRVAGIVLKTRRKNSILKIMTAKTKPIKKEEEVKQNPDPHIAQDYPGFPSLPSTKKNISPRSAKEKKLAGAVNKQHPKKTYGD